MHFLETFFLWTIAATSVTAGAATICGADSCFRAVRNDRRGKQDCNSSMRRTVTPAVFSSTSTVTITNSETSTSTEIDLTSTTSTLGFSETTVSTVTQTPSVTISTTGTIQPFAGGAPAKRDVTIYGHFPVPTSGDIGDFEAIVARAAAVGRVGHFSRSVKVDTAYVQRHMGSWHKPQKRAVTKISPLYNGQCASVEQYMSACSCVGAVPVTTTLSQISTTVTDTLFQTLSFTETTLTTDIRSFTESSTSTESTVTTTTTTFTATYSTSVLASPTCTSFRKGPNAQFIYDYRLEYAGFKVLNDINPANSDPRVPFFIIYYPGTFSACAAADSCTSVAGASFTPIGTGGYFTINLRFRTNFHDWQCYVYYDQAPPSFYNVDDPSIGQSFGWTKRP